MWLLIGLILKPPVVIGNTFLSDKLILEAFEKGVQEVLILYKNHGFLKTKIRIKNDTLWIDEGRQFRVGEIRVTGNQVFEESKILALLNTKPHKIFNESEFTEDIEMIIKEYENSGYPFCEVEIKEIRLEGDSINIELCITEGPLIRIKDIKIEGNKITKDYVITRELRIKLGDIFSHHKISSRIKKVASLKFVEIVDFELQNKDNLIVYINEKPTSYIDGVLGYGKKGFTGLVTLEVLNLFGTGRAICGKWQKIDTTSIFFHLKYKEPWVFGIPINFISSFSHRAEYSYLKNWIELLIDMPITLSFTVNIGINRTWINDFSQSNISRTRGILGIDFNTYSIPGVHYALKTEWSFAKLEEFSTNLDNYFGRKAFLVGFLSINGKAILMEEVGIYDKIRVGGATTIRGYWEEEFCGIRVGWINFELQKFIGRNNFIFPFFDIGYIDGIIKQSWGGGVAVNSPIGIVKIVYALPKNKSFMEGKIHLSIKTAF